MLRAVGPLGATGWQASPARGLAFERRVQPGGYLWWYLDAISDDGSEALTLIAFVGSVFSPYYAWAGRKDPQDHVALNVALYRKGLGRWAMTERGRADLSRSADALQLGPSALRSVGDALEIEVSEQGWPIPRKLRGKVRVVPEVKGQGELVLSAAGDHRWWPIAPRARVEVSFDEPNVKWSGTGYLDSNWGAEPLEDGFANWTWSRAPLKRGATVLYDVVPRRSEGRTMAMRFDAAGVAHEIAPPPTVKLPTTIFGIGRQTRSEGGASLVRTLTDAHFYARSVVRAQLCGEDVLSVHESLSLDRFATRWAKLLLPFRMPRKVR